jgi:hypothetical protein
LSRKSGPEGSRWDAILENLRAEGFSKIDCIRATVEVLRLPLADAKRLVHESRAWADRRDQDDQWHDALIAELEAEASRRPACLRGRSVSMTSRPNPWAVKEVDPAVVERIAAATAVQAS